MTTEQILQECKKEVAEEFKQTVTILTQYVKLWYAEKVANLYAQKIAELFAEWKDERYESYVKNGQTIYFINGDTMEFRYTLSDLYTEFLNQLNSTK